MIPPKKGKNFTCLKAIKVNYYCFFLSLVCIRHKIHITLYPPLSIDLSMFSYVYRDTKFLQTFLQLLFFFCCFLALVWVISGDNCLFIEFISFSYCVGAVGCISSLVFFVWDLGQNICGKFMT